MPELDYGDYHGTFAPLAALGLRTAGLPFPGRPLALHAQLTSVGHEERTTTDYDWHGLRRGSAAFCLFQYTLAGRGQLAWEGRRYTVLPGQAMLLWFPHDNRYWLAQGDRWRHFYLCLGGHEVARAWRTVVARRGPLVELDPDGPTLRSAVEACVRGASDRLTDPFAASALAYAVAMHLLSETVGVDAPARERHPGIAAALRLADERLAEDLGVAELAAAAGMSRNHFTRTFAASEGTSPSEHLTRIRMRRAARLLRESGLGIAEVGLRCGYHDPAYFCRAFRRALGVSPGEFRDSGMY